MTTEPFLLVDGSGDLHALAEKLKGDLPLSSYVYNSLLLHARGHADSYVYYVIKASQESNIVLWKNKKNQMAVGIHCPDTKLCLLEEALKNTKIIDFSKSLCIFHVLDDLLQLLQNIAKEKVGEEMTQDPADDFSFEVSLEVKPIECPAGYRVYRLGKAGVHHLHENWRYKIAVSVQTIMDLTKHAANVGIYEDPDQKESYIVETISIPVADDDKIPVSWIAATLHGPQGMQGTDARYRNRGFASLLAQVCARMMANDGFFPHANVEDNLQDLKKLYQNLPGCKFNRRATWLWQMVDQNGKVMKKNK